MWWGFSETGEAEKGCREEAQQCVHSWLKFVVKTHLIEAAHWQAFPGNCRSCRLRSSYQPVIPRILGEVPNQLARKRGLKYLSIGSSLTQVGLGSQKGAYFKSKHSGWKKLRNSKKCKEKNDLELVSLNCIGLRGALLFFSGLGSSRARGWTMSGTWSETFGPTISS